VYELVSMAEMLPLEQKELLHPAASSCVPAGLNVIAEIPYMPCENVCKVGLV